MTLIDTHCHLNFDAYNENRDEIVQQAAQASVTRIINPAIDVQSTQQAIALAEKYPGVYAAAGVHPNSTADFSGRIFDQISALARDPRIVAIGEIGLDYYRDRSPKSRQWRAFEDQLELAAELELPVIIHNREADEDVLSIVTKWVRTLPESLKDRPGVLHSFSAPQAIANRALELGFYLGFTGPITFKKADELRQIAARVPDDRILIETDGPFLTPHPYRGKFPNKPAYVRYVAERIATLRNVSDRDFARQSTANAERLFALPPWED